MSKPCIPLAMAEDFSCSYCATPLRTLGEAVRHECPMLSPLPLMPPDPPPAERCPCGFPKSVCWRCTPQE